MKQITPKELAKKIEAVELPPYDPKQSRVELFLLTINGQQHESFSDGLWEAFGSLNVDQNFDPTAFELPAEEPLYGLGDNIIEAVHAGELMPQIAARVRSAYARF